MACRGKFDNMAPVFSSKGEKRKENFNNMMAKRFGSNGRDVAAELRTIADALEETLEFQRLMGKRSRTEDPEDRPLSQLADPKPKGDKINGVLDHHPPRLSTPSQERSMSRDSLRRTSRSVNLNGVHDGQSDPRSYGRSAAERLPLNRHFSENDIPQEILRPSSTQPGHSMAPQPARAATFPFVRSMTPQPAPTSVHFPYRSDIRQHSQPPYARSPGYTSIIARGGLDRHRSRPPPSQRLYEVPDPPQTYSLDVPPQLDPNPYYRPQIASPAERASRRDRFPRMSEERRGRKMEPTVRPKHHETIYQVDSNIIEREYDPEKDEDAESIGSLDHVQSFASPQTIKPQNRVTWNGSFR
ncbi:uncharacterized protein Bfra_007130 [Botrytis fragariae]|uniref:Uncharacterized protein n=1 Tax=Botrytis fragariae TaxID=1964551 RepID=A0A8H6AIK2_9HELO|nr:uncharacterized protein Bfra_007130 [Botrytis fragariae]KAF5867935.1 hypothetical protein Bfra_007130 [Botrytis fragariae]